MAQRFNYFICDCHAHAKPALLIARRVYTLAMRSSSHGCMAVCGPCTQRSIQLTHLPAHACMCINYKIIIIKLLLINEIQDIVLTCYRAFITLYKSVVIEILTSSNITYTCEGILCVQ